MKKIFAFMLVFLMILSITPIGSIFVYADSTQPSTISVESAYAMAGDDVDIDIVISNNPGIAGAKFTLSFDPELTLINAAAKEAFDVLDYTSPGVYTSPCNFNWDSLNAVAAKNGSVLTLTFKVSAEVDKDKLLSVNISYRYGDIYDGNLDSLSIETKNGTITVIDYIPGDVNGDGVVNGKDVTLIRRYNAGGYGVTINEAAADVNDDGVINGKDVTLIRRYNAGGYDVELKPSTPKCSHNMEHFAAKDATCTENGNIEYWHCTKCDKCFNDADAIAEIDLSDVLINAAGHNLSHYAAVEAKCESEGNIEYWYCTNCKHSFIDSNAITEIDTHQTVINRLNHPMQYRVIDQAVAPTYTETGLTEGEHCSLCGKVLRAQETIQVLQNSQHSITYKNLKSAENNNNPSYYWSKDGLSSFKAPGEINGYVFAGWFTEEAGGTEITGIPAGSTEEVVVYAHWHLVKYTITYECGPAGINSINNPIEYTIEDKIDLYAAESTDRYRTFAYWLDSNNRMIGRIENSTGNITLKAKYRWVSMRNKVTPYSEMANPAYAEKTQIKDPNNNIYYFTYYLGRIDNIVVNTSLSKEYTGTGTEVLSLTVKTATSKTVAESVTKTLSDVDTWQQTFSNSISSTMSATVTVAEEAGFPGAVKESVSASISASATSSSSMSEAAIRSHSLTNSNSSSESFTVSSEEDITDTKTWDITCPTGYYRLDKVCSADVFAVVVYSVDDNTFYVETFDIVNDDITSMWDYSEDSLFKTAPVDLPFEAPIDEITASVISILNSQSDGISVSFNEELNKMSIDISECQSIGNLNNAYFPWLSDGVFTVFPGLGNVKIDTVEIIGDHNGTETLIDSFSLKISDKYKDGNIKVILENVGVYTTGEMGLVDSGTVDVTLDYYGKNTVCAHNGTSAATAQSAIIVNNLTISSPDVSASLSIYGGNGKSGSTYGESGGNGGNAIISDHTNINTLGQLTIAGGSGGNGYKGASGSSGYTRDDSYEIDRWYGVFGAHIATIYKYYKATSGSNGQNGGNGGDAGVPIEGEITIESTGTVTIKYGNGGNGGNGGKGGNGGNGHNYASSGTGLAFLFSYRPGDGGNGGKGGNGGAAGISNTKNYSFAESNVVIEYGTDGIGGNGGAGGSAGIGGNGGTGEYGGTIDTVGNASNGTAGTSGSHG